MQPIINANITDTPPAQMSLEECVAELRTVNRKLDLVLKQKPRDSQERAETETITRDLQVRWSQLAHHLLPTFETLRKGLRR